MLRTVYSVSSINLPRGGIYYGCFLPIPSCWSFPHWEEEAPRILSSFRRDYANASHDFDIKALVDELKKVSPEFHQFWKEHDVHAPCNGSRELKVDGETITFEHTSLIIDANRHLRLVVYAKSEQD